MGRQDPARELDEATATSSPSFRQHNVTLPPGWANPEKPDLIINNHIGRESRSQNGIGAQQRRGRGGGGAGSARCSVLAPRRSSSTNLTWKTGRLANIILVLELPLGKQQPLLKLGKGVLQVGEKHKTALLPYNG